MNAVFFLPKPWQVYTQRFTSIKHNPKPVRVTKGEKLNATTTQIEPQETNVQERPMPTLTDESLPAAQVIEAQDTEAGQNPAPRFIP